MPARAAVIMAAGHGTRMKSRTPKVLHKVGGRTLLDRIIDTVQAAGCERIHVVVGTIPQVRDLVVKRLGEAAVVVQDPPKGTGHVMRIVEPSEASDSEKQVRLCNAGMYLAGRDDLFRWLSRLTDDNPKREYFLTGIVAEAVGEERLVRAPPAPETAVMGADTPMQLSQAEAEFQRRRGAHFLAEG